MRINLAGLNFRAGYATDYDNLKIQDCVAINEELNKNILGYI